jgi:hypothetical protein
MLYNISERERRYSYALVYASLLEPSPEYVAESFRRRSLSGASEPHQGAIGGGAASVVSEQPRQFSSEDI